MIEILTASKEHSEDVVRAGLAQSRPGFRIETMELVGDEWNIRISDDGGFPFDKKDKDSDDSSEKPEKADSSEESEKSEDKKEDKKDSDSEDDKGEKGEKKDDSASVEKLRSLVEELSQKVEEVVQNAAEVAEEADGKQQKMEEIHDSVKEHVEKKDGEGDLGDLGDMPKDAPLPEDAVGLEDIGPTPGAPPKGGPKPPMGAPGPAKKRPPVGAPGVSTFGRAVVANHPGVDEKGEKIELLSAALQIVDDPEFSELELVGMVKNRDGSFSAKLQPRNAS